MKNYVSETTIAHARALTTPHIVIQGYPDDEAVAHGGGRPGSNKGPLHIRQELERMTPHLFGAKQTLPVIDLGDVTGPSLGSRHDRAGAQVEELLHSGHRVVTLGGGHDYGFPDGRGFLSVFPENSLIINFDAHLDVRDLSRGITSGTPFFRLLEGSAPFDFAEIGIQSHCNAKSHLDYVTKKGARVLSLDEWIFSGTSLTEFVFKRLDPWLTRRRPTYLSLDIDVLAASHAPGCSAAQPLGIPPLELYTLMELLMKRLDVRLFGIYEVSPPLDVQNLTAKLAASFVHRFIYNHNG